MLFFFLLIVFTVLLSILSNIIINIYFWSLFLNQHDLFISGLFIFVVQSVSRVWFSVGPWTAAHQALPSFTISQSLLKFMSIEAVMLSSHTNFPVLLASYISMVNLFVSMNQYWQFLLPEVHILLRSLTFCLT